MNKSALLVIALNIAAILLAGWVISGINGIKDGDTRGFAFFFVSIPLFVLIAAAIILGSIGLGSLYKTGITPSTLRWSWILFSVSGVYAFFALVF